MRIKRGVDASEVKHQIWFAIGFTEAGCQLNDLGWVVVTSLRDGVHGPNSLHPKGLAVDIRSRDMGAKLPDVFRLLRIHLEPLGFDCVLEIDHIHIEFDPKTGEIFDGRTA